VSLAAYMWACSLPIDACKHAAYRVLLLMADDADAMGRGAWWVDSKGAATLGTSLSTVRRGRRELLSAGLIVPGDQRPVEHIRADRRPTIYDLNTPAKLMDDRARARAGDDPG
jgi:hypothetical protein